MIRDWVQAQWREPSSLWPLVTAPLALVFSLVARGKRDYDRRKARAPDVPVLIVGNISVGGAGKSPVVQALTSAFVARGYKVGILLRGYKGDNQLWPKVVCSGDDPRSVGDEAVMHSAHFQSSTAVTVVADPDRARGADFLQQQGVGIIICDDGLQHYKLARDYELVVFDQQERFSHLLPRGPLREPLARLRTVDGVLCRQGEAAKIARPMVAENAMWLYEAKSDWPRPLQSGPVLTAGVTIFGLAGIGKPDRFFKSLQQQGFDVQPRPFADHHLFTLEDLQNLESLDLPVVMTAKDAVKIQPLLDNLSKSFIARLHMVPYKAILDAGFVDDVLTIAFHNFHKRKTEKE